MAETLLSPSELKLFGREFADLQLNFGAATTATSEQKENLDAALARISDVEAKLDEIAGLLKLSGADKDRFNTRVRGDLAASVETAYLAPGTKSTKLKKEPPSVLGANNFLFRQLLAAEARLARIYAFAYEGDLYFLPKPYIFLVHGEGLRVIEPNLYQGAPGFGEADQSGATVDRWGVIAKIDRFADDVRVWNYDKEDFCLRIDIVSGPLSEVALEPAMAGDASTSRADMTSRASMAMRASMAGNGGGGADMAARASLAVRHRFTR